MQATKPSILAICWGSPRERRNQMRATGWMFLFAAAWVGVSVGIKHNWLAAGFPATAAVLLPIGVGLLMLLAYRKFLRECDELQRKIQLDALALTVGVALVSNVAATLLLQARVIDHADSNVIILIMAVTYMVTVLAGRVRYA